MAIGPHAHILAPRPSDAVGCNDHDLYGSLMGRVEKYIQQIEIE